MAGVAGRNDFGSYLFGICLWPNGEEDVARQVIVGNGVAAR